MIPHSHHGEWSGTNRLWLEDPQTPERSEGRIDAQATKFTYAWAFRGAPQEGQVELSGPSGAQRLAWRDSWHAKSGMTLHGRWEDKLLLAVGTYSGGDGPDWGWRIELDARDPEHLTLRMFNLAPEGGSELAVELRAARTRL